MKNKSEYPFAIHDEVISASRLKTLSDCTLKHHFKYDLKLPDLPKYYLTRGIVFHEVMHEFLLDRSKSLDYYLDFALAKFNESEKNGLPVSDQKTTKALVFSQIKEAFKVSFETHKNIKNFSVLDFDTKTKAGIIPSLELEFRVPFVDIKTMEPIEDMNYDAYGFIDEISISSKNGISVRDHKMHKIAYTPFAVETDLQLGLYAYVFKFLVKMGCFPGYDESMIKTVRVGFNSHKIKTNDVELKFINYDVTDDQINGTVQVIKELMDLKNSGVHPPRYGDHCNYTCGYKDACLLKRAGKDVSNWGKNLVSGKKISEFNIPIMEEL